jgi:hypothetical protein
MTTEEIQRFLDYRKENLPKLEESARSLNEAGARAIFGCLMTFAYNFSDLLLSRTWLIKQLENYIDLEQALEEYFGNQDWGDSEL